MFCESGNRMFVKYIKNLNISSPEIAFLSEATLFDCYTDKPFVNWTLYEQCFNTEKSILSLKCLPI